MAGKDDQCDELPNRLWSALGAGEAAYYPTCLAALQAIVEAIASGRYAT
jgi:hypothetical protein